MRFAAVMIVCFLSTNACKPRGDNTSTAKDTGIVTTSPENQRASAFCWAYAIVAHIEQRHYEQTRGATRGGFRLNLSEEYLGMIHLTNQLIEGKPSNEGLRLSESLKLVEKYGILPEKVGERVLFKPIFDFTVAPLVVEAANRYWQDHHLPEFTPFDGKEGRPGPEVAMKILGEIADPADPQKKLLSDEQRKFLLAAMGYGPAAEAQFRYGISETGTPLVYSPQTFAKNRLKFSAADYYVMTFPDSGRGQSGENPFDPNYLRALKIIKKVMLSGYSIPISFNFIRSSKSENGVISCVEPGCWDAELATPTPDWPHANHAVLLLDYRSEQSSFEPVTAASLQQSYETVPIQWVIKNSWGFNSNTSINPQLLRRYPLPAYTLMTQDFFEASHKLSPGRYEALIPRKVCLRELTPQRAWKCEDLVTSSQVGGFPKPEEVKLALDSELIIGNLNKATVSRYPVEFDATAPDLPEGSPILKLLEPSTAPPDSSITQIALTRLTKATGLSGDTFNLCGRVHPDPRVKYLAVFLANNEGDPPEPTPKAVITAQNNWRYCAPVSNSPRIFALYLQPLDGQFKALGKIKTVVQVSAAQ